MSVVSFPRRDSVCCHMRAGYGRQEPATAADCWLTTVSLFWGMCIWTFLGGIVTTLLIHLNAASSEYTAKITALNQYMAHRHLPQVVSCSWVGSPHSSRSSWHKPVVPLKVMFFLHGSSKSVPASTKLSLLL